MISLSPRHAPFRHRRQGPASANQAKQIVDHQIGHGVARMDRGRADMRQQGGVGEVEQGLRHVRLVGEDVEPGRKDGAVGQRRGQRRLVDRAAAPDIDEDAVRPERLQNLGVDGLFGRGTARRHRNQRVDRLRQRHQRRVIGVGETLDLPPVVIGDRQPERLQPPRDGLPDAAHAENAGRRPRKVRPGQRIGPLSLPSGPARR